MEFDLWCDKLGISGAEREALYHHIRATVPAELQDTPGQWMQALLEISTTDMEEEHD